MTFFEMIIMLSLLYLISLYKRTPVARTVPPAVPVVTAQPERARLLALRAKITERAWELRGFTRDNLRPAARKGDAIVGDLALRHGMIQVKDNSFLVSHFLGEVDWAGSGGQQLSTESKADRVEAAIAELPSDDLSLLLSLFKHFVSKDSRRTSSA